MSRKNQILTPVGAATGLFVLAALAVFCACISILGVKLGNAPVMPWEQLIPLGAYLAGVPLALVWLKLSGWKGDAGLVGAVFLLCGIGLAIQFRMGSFAQGLAKPSALMPFPLGLAAFVIGATLTGKGRGSWLAGAGWLAYLAALGVLAAMLLLGQRYRGGIYLPGNMNPSEIVKPLLVLFLAAYLSRRQKAFSETQNGIPVPPLHALLGLVLLWSVPMLLTIALKDLGLMVLLNAILIVMLFAIARSTGYLALGLAAVAAAGFGVRFISAHAQARFDVWLNPFADPTGKGWQILQALSAMYSGGLWGAGLGSGVPQSVPIVSSDFVYAAVAEEIGLIGCVLLLMVYAALFSRGFRAAGAARTPFERLLCVGLTGALGVQTILNVAGVTKALPMTGITLPLISHGGSSLITTLLVAGLIAGISDRK
ncbi:MAG TPA: FtsW/RodA/SpoVE family cell cycle protein [Kiritimatiellia bacterium]|nr:FtsW/RodA/SpoVE family cell cycle protein [Kiritimatiellia bacterium]